MIRVLEIDNDTIAKVKGVLDFALQRSNWYRPFTGRDARMLVPGDDKRHTVKLNSYRCVFSITIDTKGNAWRDLSISVPSDDYPNPTAAFTIAELFGFKDSSKPSNVAIDVCPEEHCVRMAQPYELAA